MHAVCCRKSMSSLGGYACRENRRELLGAANVCQDAFDTTWRFGIYEGDAEKCAASGPTPDCGSGMHAVCCRKSMSSLGGYACRENRRELLGAANVCQDAFDTTWRFGIYEGDA